jgi:hypothetical protein
MLGIICDDMDELVWEEVLEDEFCIMAGSFRGRIGSLEEAHDVDNARHALSDNV